MQSRGRASNPFREGEPVLMGGGGGIRPRGCEGRGTGWKSVSGCYIGCWKRKLGKERLGRMMLGSGVG